MGFFLKEPELLTTHNTMADGQLQEIKDRLDVVEVLSTYIRVVKAGRNFKALCPFHNEKTPSFVISPDRQIWHCFGCGEGGDIFTFVMKIEGMEFPEALKVLAERAGVELKKTGYSALNASSAEASSAKKTNIFAICEAAKDFYKYTLLKSPEGSNAKKYLLGRGLTEESIKIFEIGYAPDDWHTAEYFLKKKGFNQSDISAAGFTIKNDASGAYHDRFRGRIMFPILDISGRTVGFGGRTFAHKESDEAKYINTPESPIYSKSKILYGLNFARDFCRKNDSCILVEGYMDVIGSHQMNVRNAVSSSGTALTQDQIKIIKRYTPNLILAFDGDLAGQEATSRSIDLAIDAGMNVRVITLPDDKDPSDYVSEPEDWKKHVKEAKRIIDFYFENSFSRNDPHTVEGKKAAAEELLEKIKRIPSSVERAHWIGVLAEKIGIEEKVLTGEMEKIKTEKKVFIRNAEAGNKAAAVGMSPASTLGGQEEKWEGQLLALLTVSSQIPQKIQKIKESDFGFVNRNFKEAFQIIAGLAEQGAEEDIEGEIKKLLPPEVFGKLSEMILEMEYLQDIEGSEESNEDWKEENFYAILERLVLRRYEVRKKALEADIRVADKKRDHDSIKLLVMELSKTGEKMEEVKKYGLRKRPGKENL